MQKTVLEMRVSDWSSDVCSSDLKCGHRQGSCRRLQPGAVAQDFRRGDFPADEAGIPMPAIPDVFPQPKVLEQATGVLWPGAMGHISGNREFGRASCRERECTYVEICVGAVS